MPDRGCLIVFSGLDGAGKSTQIELLMEHLRQQGREPVYLWSRGGYTPLFEGLKALLRGLPGRVVPPAGDSLQRTQALSKRRVRRLWLMLALLDLLWVYGVQVRWWRGCGRAVVCDRYMGDTLVDFRQNFAKEQVESWWLWRLLEWIVPRPNVTFLMLVPVDESLRRSELKNAPFPDTPEVLAFRLAQYQAMSELYDWHVLDGLRPIDATQTEIQSAIQDLPDQIERSD